MGESSFQYSKRAFLMGEVAPFTIHFRHRVKWSKMQNSQSLSIPHTSLFLFQFLSCLLFLHIFVFRVQVYCSTVL